MHISKGNDFCDFLFASLDDKALSKAGLLLKVGICSYRSKFFPLRVDPIEKEGKMKMAELLSQKVSTLTIKAL